MSQFAKMLDTLSEMPSWGSCPSQAQGSDSRTVTHRHLRAIVPSIAVILSMSTLTIIILVLLVTTVAETMPPARDASWQHTTWSRWGSSSDITLGARTEPYADRAQYDMRVPTESQIPTAYTASWLPPQ